MIEAFGIFEGGGAKGLAHVGALKVMEEKDVKFRGVAGTSAGSIIAALVAAGYTADELYHPERNDSVLGANLTEFVDVDEWDNLSALRSRFSKFKLYSKPKSWERFSFWWMLGTIAAVALVTQVLFAAPVQQQLITAGAIAFAFVLIDTLLNATLINWIKLTYAGMRCKGRLGPLATSGGFLTADKFEKWLNTKLVEKLAATKPGFTPTGDNGAVSFRDLPLPLKVIASDVLSRKLKVFALPDDINQSVAEAVSASIRIPFVFAPKRSSNACYVDGGIMSNFPAWVFDAERRNAPALTPTLGFRLVEVVAPAPDASATAFSLYEFAIDLYNTAVFGDNTLEKREIATLHEIPLQVKVNSLQFELDESDKRELYRGGKLDANEFFNSVGQLGRRPNIELQAPMQAALSHIRKRSGHDGHLRMNVMLPISSDEMQVIYHVNMDGEEDCDDMIVFRKDVGACGCCWSRLQFVICDLEDARETYAGTWKMNKYQQRLVRSSLKSLVSVPIFDQRKISADNGDRHNLEKAFIGVMNIDSDENVIQKFREIASDDTLTVSAGLLANYLTKSH